MQVSSLGNRSGDSTWLNSGSLHLTAAQRQEQAQVREARTVTEVGWDSNWELHNRQSCWERPICIPRLDYYKCGIWRSANKRMNSPKPFSIPLGEKKIKNKNSKLTFCCKLAGNMIYWESEEIPWRRTCTLKRLYPSKQTDLLQQKLCLLHSWSVRLHLFW